MKKYLLPESGKFYKANLHCHTTVSDGKMTPEEIKKYYKENGYSVVAFTDHDVLVPHPELTDEEFLPLNGYEMEVNEEGEGKSRKTCHMCLVALEPDNLKQVCYHRSRYLFGNSVNYTDKIQYDENEPDYVREYTHECISDMMKKGRENGFFVTYNHPSWSLENYTDYMGYNNMHAMEIYNNECINMGYCDYNEKEYDDMLRGGKRIYCLATDDCHKLETCCGGYIMIKADKLEYKTITNAMVAGNFYASYGPSIYKLWFEDNKIHIECSDAVSIKMNTARRCAKKHKSPEGSFVNGACFDVVPEDGYVRITVVDKNGKHANTNAYFTDELFA